MATRSASKDTSRPRRQNLGSPEYQKLMPSPEYSFSSDLQHVCEACLMGKQQRKAFPQESSNRAQAPLELVHADLCGKMSTSALGGSFNFLLLVDDYSRKMWVYFIREKSEAFGKFKLWHKLVENETGKKVKKLRTDRGGEFISDEFNSYCNDYGIKRQLTTAHTPQQNGVVKRGNPGLYTGRNQFADHGWQPEGRRTTRHGLAGKIWARRNTKS
ncbi:hypothetical protein L7F22_048882 [Adiantum nelumboides]|nr:hypothetical protein [Adiantum nelumboides]